MVRSSLLVASGSSWSGPAVAALTMSILALAVSVFALGWQVVSWRRSGARLKVAIRQGLAGFDEGHWFIGVEIRNTGRLATEISNAGFQLSRKESRRQIVDLVDVMGQRITLPRTLEPGATTTIYYDAHRLLATLDNDAVDGVGARAYADTAHGRTHGRRVRLRDMAHNLAGP